MLWDKIREGLFEVWNNPIYYFLDSRETIEERGVEREVKRPLTTSIIAQHLKWTTRRVRKVLKGLNICRKGIPDFVKVSGKAYRVIFFEPEKLEKRLREFVVDYKPGEIFEKMKVTQVTKVTDYLHEEDKTELEKSEIPPYRESVTSVTSVTAKESGEYSCFICGRWILKGQSYTFMAGRPCHVACLNQYMAGRSGEA